MPRILDPQNTTSYGTFMNSSRWFVLNISSSSSVKVMISLIQHPTGESVKTPIWEQTGDNFRQEVSISGSGTYFVDIINENSFSVTLDGNVLVQQEVERYRTIYPYVIPGFLIMLGGISVCIFGIFRMAKKPSRSKSVTKKK